MSAALSAVLPSAAALSWLVSASLNAALLLALAWLGAMLLRRGAPAARHQLWTLGVAGALLVPLLSLALPPLLPSAAPTLGAGRALFAPAALITPGGTASAGSAAAPSWPSWLALAWLAGTLFVSLRFLRGHLAARRLSRAAEPARAAPWLTAQREAAAALALSTRVQLGRSAAIASPMTIGLLAPRVILPAAADTWSPQRLRAVLLHELGHVRRRDTLVQLAAQLACALYWWNPLAWLAAARLRVEREHACDDLVLGAGTLPSSYAADLLDVARALPAAAPARAGAVCMADRSHTEVRLRRILDAAAPRRAPGSRFRRAALAAALACTATLACTSAPLSPPAPAAAVPPAAPAASTPAAPAAARAVRSSLTVGVPSITDSDPDYVIRPLVLGPHHPIDLGLVAEEVNRNLEDLRRCYEQRLLSRPGLAGEVVIHWGIGASGEVTEQCITRDTVGDAGLVTCVNQLVASTTFPAHGGSPIDVSFPFVFSDRPTL